MVPPDQEAQQSGPETVADEVDSVEHFGAGRARKSLRNGEKLLILTNNIRVNTSTAARSRIHTSSSDTQPAFSTNLSWNCAVSVRRECCIVVRTDDFEVNRGTSKCCESQMPCLP